MTRRVATALVVVAGVWGVVLSWVVAQHSLVADGWDLSVYMAAWAPAWVLGALAARRLERRRALLLVIGFAALTRAAAVTGTYPSISNDVYRYSWDAHVQLAGIDPYRYPPDAKALVHLRDNYYLSPATCVQILKKPGCTELNRLGDRTIYPAVGEAWFVFVHLFNPHDAGSRPWLVAGAIVDTVCVALMAAALARRRRDPREVAWYALSPLPVIEFAGNGHVDGVALALLLLGLVCLDRRRLALAGALVGAATMVKLYPAAAALAWLRTGGRRLVAAAAVVVVASEAPHVAAVGPKVVGYLPGYLKEERYTTGNRFLLVGVAHVHGKVAEGVAVAVVLAVLVAVTASHTEPLAGLVAMLTTVILVTTPVQPWYGVVVGGLGVVAGRPWLLVLAAAGEPYYAATILHQHDQFAVGRVAYGVALAVAVGGEVARRRHRPAGEPTGEDAAALGAPAAP